VLIFGVAAANAAIVDSVPFGAPFTILCALALASFVLGPFAAAAALRHGMEGAVAALRQPWLIDKWFRDGPDRPRQSVALRRAGGACASLAHRRHRRRAPDRALLGAGGGAR